MGHRIKRRFAVFYRRLPKRNPDGEGKKEAEKKLLQSWCAPEWTRTTSDYWPSIRQTIETSDSAEDSARKLKTTVPVMFPRPRRWALAAAGAVLLASIVIGVFYWKYGERRQDQRAGKGPLIDVESAARVQVISVEFEGRKAKPYLFQTPRTTFIWISPTKDIGG